MSWQDLSPEDAHDLLAGDDPPYVLDVRTEPEFERHRLENARLLPVHELAERCAELDPDTAYLVVCEHGVRSVAACEFLASRGFPRLTNLSGGMAHWLAQGLPARHSP